MAIGWVSLYFLGGFWSRFWLWRRMGDEQIAQEEAEAFLESKGFKIVDRRRRGEIITYVDGKPHISFVQADFIVSKRDRIYVAEVKTGTYAPDPSEPAARRQLLEYDFVYKPDGVLVVDMIEKRIHLIQFGLPERKTERLILLVVGLMIISILAGLIYLYIQVKLF